MWDRPEILNSIAGALIAVSVLLALYGGVITLTNLPLFPVRQVLVSNALQPAGQLQHVTRDQIYAVVTQRLRGTFFSIDLEAARNAFAALPWVRSVEVRRTWPDRLEVAIEEQVAFATWSDGKLVNTHGELFDAALVNGLPAFSGPDGSEGEITRRYREFETSLATLGLSARQVVLSPRLAWELKLDNGLALKLGREQPRDPIAARVQRFVAAYADVVGKVKEKLVYADLRYPQGFALQLPQAAAIVTRSKGLAGPKGPASPKGNA
jgi:cell division protein FtsQ